MIKLKELLTEKSFQAIYNKKNKWIELIKKNNRKELVDNLYVLIDGAYGKLGGHVGIKTPNDILSPNYAWWEAVDVDIDPEADAVIFGKKTKFGFKMSGLGHDGQSKSKSIAIDQMSKQLNKKGYWIEASGKLSKILKRAGTPYLTSQEDVERLWSSKVEWFGDGQYKRLLPDTKKNTDIERLYGKPKF
jgi:hypothetical protein